MYTEWNMHVKIEKYTNNPCFNACTLYYGRPKSASVTLMYREMKNSGSAVHVRIHECIRMERRRQNMNFLDRTSPICHDHQGLSDSQ
jgi:hypothetical protein